MLLLITLLAAVLVYAFILCAQTPAVYIQPGAMVPDPSSTTRAGGDVVNLGSIPFVVAPTDPNLPGVNTFYAEGVFDVPKTTDTFTAGDAVYWNSSGTPVTGTASSGAADTATGNLMGVALADAATGASYVRTKLYAAKRTTTIGGAVTAADITGEDSSLGVLGLEAAQGGAILITGGVSTTAGNAGGAVGLVGGTPGVTGVGGAVALTGGIGGATSGTGGAIAIAGGAGTASNANGGAVTIKGGEPHGSGQQGTVTIEGVRTAAGTTAVAITAATTLTLADSGGMFTVNQGAAYDIDLPSPTTGAGLRYTFMLIAPAANAVTITVAGSAATFEGTIINDVTSVLPCTGSTITFASGAILGDSVEIISYSTGKYFARTISSAAGGITIA